MHKETNTIIIMDISNYSCKFYNGNQILNSYLNEIRKYKVLTNSEERQIFNLIKEYKQSLKKKQKDGDIHGANILNNKIDSLKNEIVKRNQRFIYSLAKIYSKNEDEVLDFVNEGNIGLITAIDTYEVNNGNTFLTYAVWYIRRSMNYYMSTKNKMVKRSNNMKLEKKIEAIKRKYFLINGYQPPIEDIIDILRDEYDIIIKEKSDVFDLNISSINSTIDDEDYTIEETNEYNVRTSSYNLYDKNVDTTYNNLLIDKLMKDLPSKQRDIINMSFGIGYDKVYSSSEIGEKYSLSEVTVNKIKTNVLEYLRENKNKYKLVI